MAPFKLWHPASFRELALSVSPDAEVWEEPLQAVFVARDGTRHVWRRGTYRRWRLPVNPVDKWTFATLDDIDQGGERVKLHDPTIFTGFGEGELSWDPWTKSGSLQFEQSAAERFMTASNISASAGGTLTYPAASAPITVSAGRTTVVRLWMSVTRTGSTTYPASVKVSLLTANPSTPTNVTVVPMSGALGATVGNGGTVSPTGGVWERIGLTATITATTTPLIVFPRFEWPSNTFGPRCFVAAVGITSASSGVPQTDPGNPWKDALLTSVAWDRPWNGLQRCTLELEEA